jgi:MtN3 and saliva related transmembrane protein
MTILATLAILFGTLGALGNVPQAIKIFRRKSAKDISIISYAIFMTGCLIWTLYGIEIKNFALIISNGLAICIQACVVIGWFKYGREKRKK